MIASENYTSPAVMQAMGSVLTNKYAEGYPGKPLAGAQATVAKLIERLEAKDCIDRQRGEGPQQFRANIDRNALIGWRLQTVANQLCDGSLSPLLTTLVKAGSLSARERKELAQLLDCKVHLFLHVKVVEGWSDDKEIYEEIGLEWVK